MPRTRTIAARKQHKLDGTEYRPIELLGTFLTSGVATEASARLIALLGGRIKDLPRFSNKQKNEVQNALALYWFERSPHHSPKWGAKASEEATEIATVADHFLKQTENAARPGPFALVKSLSSNMNARELLIEIRQKILEMQRICEEFPRYKRPRGGPPDTAGLNLMKRVILVIESVDAREFEYNFERHPKENTEYEFVNLQTKTLQLIMQAIDTDITKNHIRHIGETYLRDLSEK